MTVVPAEELAGWEHLVGDRCTVADSHLFTLLGWADHAGAKLADRPTLKTYRDRIATRPAVRDALKAEGLVM